MNPVVCCQDEAAEYGAILPCEKKSGFSEGLGYTRSLCQSSKLTLCLHTIVVLIGRKVSSLTQKSSWRKYHQFWDLYLQFSFIHFKEIFVSSDQIIYTRGKATFKNHIVFFISTKG